MYTIRVVPRNMSYHGVGNFDTKQILAINGLRDEILVSYLISTVDGLYDASPYDTEEDNVEFRIKKGINVDNLVTQIQEEIANYEKRHTLSGYLQYSQVAQIFNKQKYADIDPEMLVTIRDFMLELKQQAIRNSWGNVIHLDDFIAAVDNHPKVKQAKEAKK